MKIKKMLNNYKSFKRKKGTNAIQKTEETVSKNNLQNRNPRIMTFLY